MGFGFRWVGLVVLGVWGLGFVVWFCGFLCFCWGWYVKWGWYNMGWICLVGFVGLIWVWFGWVLCFWVLGGVLALLGFGFVCFGGGFGVRCLFLFCFLDWWGLVYYAFVDGLGWFVVGFWFGFVLSFVLFGVGGVCCLVCCLLV